MISAPHPRFARLRRLFLPALCLLAVALLQAVPPRATATPATVEAEAHRRRLRSKHGAEHRRRQIRFEESCQEQQRHHQPDKDPGEVAPGA